MSARLGVACFGRLYCRYMPGRWLVPFSRVDVTGVGPTHVHAAFSRWFDATDGEHTADLKPYTVSPVLDLGDRCAVEVSVLSDEAEFHLRRNATVGTVVRLGRQSATITSSPGLLARSSWAELAGCTNDRDWVVRFESPASFRQGNRTTPWPAPVSLLRGLGLRWERWSGLPPRGLRPQVTGLIWVSDLQGASDVVTVGRGARKTHFSGFVGWVRYRCDDPAVAAEVGPLFHLAEYAGVGSATTKGLGRAWLEPTGQTPVRSAARA